MKRRSPLPLLLLVPALLAGSLVVATPSQAAGRPIACLPVSGLGSTTHTKARQFMTDGKLTLPGYPAVAIGTSGNVNWGIDPFHNQSWRRLFLSLKWLDQLTSWYSRYPSTDADMLARAEAYADDFAHDNPAGGGPRPADAWVGMYAGQRATVYTCLDSLSPGRSRTRAALAAHGTWLNDPNHDPGAWNQGVDTYIGLLADGCVYGNTSWADHASQRLDQLVSQTIASDGSINEQAPGYGDYLNSRWGVATQVLTECGRAVPTNLATRRAGLLTFLAWSSEPNGNVAQIGDSVRAPVSIGGPGVVGSPAEWTATRGTQGTHPTPAFRTYSTGWAFGRSTWDPYVSSAWFAVRWGAGRKLHGHDDHQSVLLDARGKQVLVDSGHYGYTSGAYRDYLTSPAAHNVLTEPGVAYNKLATTTLTHSGGTGSWRWYEMTDTGYGGRARTRSVLVDTSLPLVLTFDRASRATSGSFQQLWHLAPGTRVSIPSRSVAVATSADGAMKTTLIQFALPGQTLASGATSVVSGRTSPYQGWVSYGIGKRTAAPTVVMSRSGRSVAMVSLVLATAATTRVSANLKLGSDGYYHVNLVVGSVTRTLRISGGGTLAG